MRCLRSAERQGGDRGIHSRHPHRLQVMGEAAKARVQDWTWDRVVERMLPSLREAASV